MIPNGSTYISSGRLSLENLPGFWVHFKMNISRVRSSVGGETIMYQIFYKNKIIQMYGGVWTSINGKEFKRGDLKKYESLFDLMANSLVIPDLYR